MKLTKIDLFNILAFAGLLVIFYPGLFLAREASLMGDHWEQHYPWAVLMAQSLKQGVWPFWTPLIQCGFPIAAESQIGLFYLPNLILYALLPIQWAYAYMNPLHFFIAGLGTYVYCRKMVLTPLGALVAGVVFAFGAGYGGAYYNLTSLKTLAWFPWVLWAFEEYLTVFRKRYVVLAAVLMWLSIVAGYLQVAALMIFMVTIYGLLRIFIFREAPQGWRDRLRAVGGLGVALLGAIILSLPQLLLTFELAMLSNRTQLSEAYAYVGSLSPPTLLTLIFPKLQGIFRGSCLYSGIFAIYFICAAFFITKKSSRQALWLWTILGLISLLLALGEWSTLYVALIKLTRFYSFRIPAKFLVFICFSLAILSGIGIQAFQETLTLSREKFRLLNRMFLGFVAGVLILWGSVYFLVTIGRSHMIAVGQWIVENFIHGRSGHPRSLESYFETVASIIDSAREMLSWTNPWLLWAWTLILCVCLWALLFQRHLAQHSRSRLFLGTAVLILALDLYVFSGIDIKRDFNSYQAVQRPNLIIETLQAEKNDGRLERLYGFRKGSETLSLIPSVNMLYGFEDIGIYSPLVTKRYFETIGQFGNVNDSNRTNDPEAPFVLERLPLLNALAVSHILSTQKLQHPDLKLLFEDPASRTYLYQNQAAHVRGYFISEAVSFCEWPVLKQALMAPHFDPQKMLLLENREKNKMRGIRLRADSIAVQIVRMGHENNRELWLVETTGPGFFVVSNSTYPGWEATINGRRTPILTAYGLFHAVWLPGEGMHTVDFSYHPYKSLLSALMHKDPSHGL